MSTNRAPAIPAIPVRQNIGMLPEFIDNAVETANCGSRIILTVALATERLVDDADQIVRIMAHTQKQRLLAEMAKQGYDLGEFMPKPA